MRPKKTILCVDDNEHALSIRKFLLETRGYRVLTATSPESGLDIFSQGGIDLVLSDLLMPQMDGNDLVRKMKEIAPEVPMVLTSGTVKAYERASCADAFLPKGQCSAQETLERIRVLLVRKRGPKKQARVALDPASTKYAGPLLHSSTSTAQTTPGMASMTPDACEAVAV